MPLFAYDTLYLPPQDTFFPLYARSLAQCPGDRIILARETGTKHVMVRDAGRRHFGDVFVDVSCAAEPGHIHLRGMLPLCGRFKLVTPNHVKENTAHTFKAYPESSYTRKQFNNFHVYSQLTL